MFNKARLKLTAWYLLIIMIISLSFSAVIFKVASSEIERFDRLQRVRIQTRFPLPQPVIIVDPTLVQETEKRIVLTLIFINTAILLVSGISGYVLAGITLSPIQDIVEEQNRFISDASHEIRTPLTSLKSTFEVHLRNRDRTLTEADTLAKESIGEVDKLQTLSESLLQLAQYQESSGHTHFESFMVSQILDDAIHKIRPLAKHKKISVPSQPSNARVYGNKYDLTDLFVILLDNAVKYSHLKGIIDIEVIKSDGHITLAIKDQGIGIEKADLPHIFDRFYRADRARSKSRNDGYGLGLSIAKKIVAIHHGTIQVQSTPHKGSIFYVCLPVNKVA